MCFEAKCYFIVCIVKYIKAIDLDGAPGPGPLAQPVWNSVRGSELCLIARSPRADYPTKL